MKKITSILFAMIILSSLFIVAIPKVVAERRYTANVTFQKLKVFNNRESGMK